MPWQGGRDHSSHRLVHVLHGSEKGAALSLYGLGIITGGLGLIATRVNLLTAVLITFAVLLGMVTLGVRLAKVECYEKK